MKSKLNVRLDIEKLTLILIYIRMGFNALV